MNNTNQSEWARAEQERQAQARARLFTLLQRHGVAQAMIEYDGYGDSGQIESQQLVNRDGIEMTVDDQELSNALDEYVCAILPLGWENNTGAFGTVAIEVADQKVHVTHNERYEDYTTHEYDVEAP